MGHTAGVDTSVNEWDLVLRGGRVIDPESGLDAVRDVAVAGGRIAAVGTGLPPGPAEEDVSGQVVTAGFVDLHSHVNDVGGLRLQALDGVTTALELEAGVTPVAEAYRRAAEQGRPVNYGFSASWALARMETVAGLPAQASLGAFMARISDPAWQRAAEPAQLTALIERISDDLADGALGIGVLLGYAPAASPQEYLRVAALAAESGVATFTHARDLAEMVPATLADGAEEIVRAAGETGAHMHYCHINSTSHRHIDRVLALVARAQAAGSRVTTEAYPYGSGMTGIGAAFLAPERLGERGLSPSSLTFAPTGERVASAARLRELRETDPGGLVIIDLLDESSPADRMLLMRSLTFPGSVVASDAMPLTWISPPADPLAWPLPPTAITHPRTAGTFCRALRLLTRDAMSGPGPSGAGPSGPGPSGAGPSGAGPSGAGPSGAGPSGTGPASLVAVLAKCSLDPARLLEAWVPAMRGKGRLQSGRDADIVVFDPETVADRASYSESTRPSAGIRHVLVNGEFVVRDGDIVPDARPGRPVRAEPR